MAMLDDLESFKEYVQKTIKPYCQASYSTDAYMNSLSPLLDDMLENLELHIENVAEETIYEEDLAYGRLDGE